MLRAFCLMLKKKTITFKFFHYLNFLTHSANEKMIDSFRIKWQHIPVLSPLNRLFSLPASRMLTVQGHDW